MKTSLQGLAFIRRAEGFSPTAYPDAGHLSIGYGTQLNTNSLLARYRHATISREKATDLMMNKVTEIEKIIEALVTQPLTQSQFDALVSFCYNLGVGALAKSTLLVKINIGDWEGAAEEFGRWVHSQGKKLDGLVARREEERKMFES